MIVVSMTNCPPKLRGDLSKWLLEINTGVYVGHVNAKVREALWKRICDNIKDGQATMVFTTNNEQHMDFYVHNTSWCPVEFDGIKLMKHPDKFAPSSQDSLKPGFSDAAKRLMAKRRRRKNSDNGYVILDIETTGLSAENDDIIEVGALEIRNGEMICEYEALIYSEKVLATFIEKLTGIDNMLLKEKGRDISVVLTELFEIISGKTVVAYNIPFDLGFLEVASEKHGICMPCIKTLDLLDEAKNKVTGVDNYRLETVAQWLGVRRKQQHRALDDCHFLHEVILKLNEL